MTGKHRPAHHDLDIYPATLHLAVTAKAFARLDRRFEGALTDGVEMESSTGATGRVFDHQARQLHIVIVLDSERIDRSTPDLVRLATHEAVHAAGMILDHFGQKYDGESEALAYLVDWIVAWVIGQYARRIPIPGLVA